MIHPSQESMNMKLILATLIFFISSAALANSLTCTDLSNAVVASKIYLTTDNINYPYIQIVNPKGDITYDGVGGMELIKDESPQLTYTSVDMDFLIALGYENEDYYPVIIQLNTESGFMEVIPVLNNVEVERKTFSCF